MFEQTDREARRIWSVIENLSSAGKLFVGLLDLQAIADVREDRLAVGQAAVIEMELIAGLGQAYGLQLSFQSSDLGFQLLLLRADAGQLLASRVQTSFLEVEQLFFVL